MPSDVFSGDHCLTRSEFVDLVEAGNEPQNVLSGRALPQVRVCDRKVTQGVSRRRRVVLRIPQAIFR